LSVAGAGPADLHREVRRILLLAGEAEGRRREEVLARECRGDRALEEKVRELLSAAPVATEAIFSPRHALPAPAWRPPLDLGPFHLRRELGRGGMGVVYEAVDSRTGEVVAVKALYAHLLALEGAARRFRREVEAGGRVRHENVVRTLGLERVETAGGVHDLLVMEYVEGRTLRDLGRSLGPLSEAMLREIAGQTAAGLRALHAADVVHRDLKPENILITEDQRIRIMDLGVARLVEGSVGLTGPGQFLGSALYAAPEQCRGEPVGPAADRYALGVVLHELATGTNHFARDRPVASLAAHLDSVPPLLDRPPGRIGPFFAELVATLLAKRPEERFGSTEELCRVLLEGEAGAWWEGRASSRTSRTAGGTALSVVRDIDFHGREAPLQRLREAFVLAQGGAGTCLLVEGEEGIGKTRLVDEFLKGLPGGDRHLLLGSFTASGGVGGITGAIRDRFGARLEAELLRRLGSGPEVAAFTRLVGGEAAGMAGDAFGQCCARLLRSLAAGGPVVWVLDDAHLASPVGRDALLSLAGAAADLPALLLLTARSVTESGSLSLDTGLSRLRNFRKIILPRLTREEVEELLGAAFGSDVTARELAGAVTERSDGVPLFVLEMIAALREEGGVRRLPSGEWVAARPVGDLKLPEMARGLLSARIPGLSREEREVLEVGAVAGAEFDAELVASALGRPLVGVLRTLAETQRRGGIVRAHGRRFRFDHVLLADHLRESLPELLREEYHGLLADAIRSRGGDSGGERSAVLAGHYLDSRRPAEAAPFLDRALEHLASHFRARVLLRLCGILMASGRGAESREVLAEARRIASRSGSAALRAEVQLHLGISESAMGRFGRAAARFRAGARLARSAGSSRIEAGALANLGVAELRLGAAMRARETLETALGVARAAEDESSELLAVVNLATLDHRHARADSARAGYLRGIDLARRLGRRPVESYAESCLGLLAFNGGNFDEADERLERALALAMETGNRPARLGALAHLSVLHHARGRHLLALRTRERLLELRRESGECDGLWAELAGRGEARLWLGDPDSARRDLEEALELARRAGDPLGTADVLIALAELEWNEGDAPAARRALLEARELLGPTGETGSMIDCAIGLARLAAEECRPLEARAEIEAAGNPAERGGQAGLLLLLAAWRAVLPGGDAPGVSARLPELEARAPNRHRMEARFLLWRATGEHRHLEEARRLALEARDLSGFPYREAMLARVRLFREIEQEWASCTGQERAGARSRGSGVGPGLR
jgi:tetratricopeptide (TPR) repeat protein